MFLLLVIVLLELLVLLGDLLDVKVQQLRNFTLIQKLQKQ